MLTGALDTFIGLITVYLILSLIVTALGEGASAWTNLKGRIFKKSIKQLVGEATTKKFFQHDAIKRLSKSGRFTTRTPSYVPDAIVAEVILDLCVNPPATTGGSATARGPLTPNTVDRALRGLNTGYADVLRDLWSRADCNIEAFKPLIAEWFNRTADRSTGWFRRQLSLYLFAIGLVAAIALNADTIYMFEALSKDKSLREAMVQHASEIVAEASQASVDCENQACRDLVERFISEEGAELNADDINQLAKLCGQNELEALSCRRDLQSRVDTLQTACAALGVEGDCSAGALISVALPDVVPLLGLDLMRHELAEFCPTANDTDLRPLCPNLNMEGAHPGIWASAKYLMGVAVGFWTFLSFKLLGWTLTAAAVSLGAPFWFDLLQKIAQIRSSTKPVASAPVTPAADSPIAPVIAEVPRARSVIRQAAAKAEALDNFDGFDTRTLGFSPVNLFWSARLAKVAYVTDEDLIGAEFEDWGAEGELLDVSNTQCLIATTPKAAFISFRGTEPKVIEDWLTDTKVKLVAPKWHANYKVHEGFDEALEHIWSTLMVKLGEHGVFSRKLPVWLSGHSLGGALATLTGLRLQQDPKFADNMIGAIHTFGQPRVGDPACADALEKAFAGRYFRTINHRDIVPRLPLPETPDIVDKLRNKQNALTVYNYAHAGHVIYFTDAGISMMDPPLWYRKLDTLAVALTKNAVVDALKQAAGDHDMTAYLNLQRSMVATQSTDVEEAS